MVKRRIIYAPRAQRDLLHLEKALAIKILEDIKSLAADPWPLGKVKKLRSHDYWEIKTGNFRSIFWLHGRGVVVLRVVNRRDLEKVIGQIDFQVLLRWIQQYAKQ